jgi:hypothetical protein
VRRWQSVARNERWRQTAWRGLRGQVQRWYDLLVLGQDPATLIRPYAFMPTWRVSLRALRALWIQAVVAAVSLAAPIAVLTIPGLGHGDVFLQAVLGVAGAAGLAVATAQAVLKNRAQDLLTRLQHDAYTDLIIAAIAEVPAKPGRPPPSLAER